MSIVIPFNTSIPPSLADSREPLGMDFCDIFAADLIKRMAGIDAFAKNGLYCTGNNHQYVILSNALRAGGQKKMVKAFRPVDTISSKIIEALDIKEYRAKKFPKALIGIGLLRLFIRLPRLIWNTLRAISSPDKFHEYFVKKTKEMEKDLREEAAREVSLRDFTVNCTNKFADYFLFAFVPVMIAFTKALSKIERLLRKYPEEVRQKIIYLEQALPNNCTIEMGLAMFRLSRFKDIQECESPDEFSSRLASRNFSHEFLDEWDSFMASYGYRCPGELDAATPRFYERPGALFEQFKTMADNTTDEASPQAVFDRGAAKRTHEYESLFQHVQGKGQKTLAQNYRLLLKFKGYRELPKSQIVSITEKFRKKALEVGRVFHAADRINEPQDIFLLKIGEIEEGLCDSNLDLRGLCRKNKNLLRKLSHARNFPRVIDSRGKILHSPKTQTAESELVGEPISPGVVRGKVKILEKPDEKPVLPGEILVTRATDPGWTPLFLNASGIILEVGGMLQHGALVAREYCKPCVAGIENITSLLKDGQYVEVDGTNGTVREIQTF